MNMTARSRKNRIISLICTAALLTGCGGGQAADSSSSGALSETAFEIVLPDNQDLKTDYTSCDSFPDVPGERVAFVAQDSDLDYWKAVREGAEQAVREINALKGYEGDDEVTLTFEGGQDSTDVESQINQIDAILAENPTALCLSAIDVASCQPQLEAARDNGIPVVSFDSSVDSPLITSDISTDNDAASHTAAKQLFEQIGGAGEIALMSHTATSQTSIERISGFLWELSDYPKVSVAANLVQNATEDTETMLNAALEIHPELKGIFCTNEQTANEVLDALEKLERTDLTVVGFDAGETQRKALEEGREYGLICQNPRAMGYISVTAALRAAAGEQVDRHIDTGYRWIDRDGLELEENRAFLY